VKEVAYSSVISRLLETVPGIRGHYEKRLPELYAVDNPHVIYGSILPEYVDQLLARREQGNGDTELRSAFALIEILASNGDFEARCLVETSVLEALLLDEQDRFPVIHPLMGPETKKLARLVMAC
jgi:hypothetical protein